MKITLLDMSGELNFEPDDVIEGDLVVIFTAHSKKKAGLEGRKLAQFLYKEIEFVQIDNGLLIIESEE
jgi:hypothetical protein